MQPHVTVSTTNFWENNKTHATSTEYMKRLYILTLALTAIFAFTQCDDNTESVGNSIIPDEDIIIARTDTFYAKSHTIKANDAILANTSDVYLGKYTNEDDNSTFSSSFITQFGCTQDFEFPSEGVVDNAATYTTLRLYIDKYYGDSLNAMRCEVYALDKTLEEGTPYYTDFDPEEFYDNNSAPLASKIFNVIDHTEPDSVINGETTRRIDIPLPNSIGNMFIEKFYETDSKGNRTGKEYFANTENFIKNVFNGVYVKCTQGDGTLVRIFRSRLDIGFDRLIMSSSGKLDSLEHLQAPFYSGKEVLQVNKFVNSNIDNLLNETGHTYIKTPACLFTEVTLPVTDIIESSDTINSAKIIFEKYNKGTGSPHSTLLMVRKEKLNSFFLKSELNDDKTSYLATLVNNKEYIFANISEMLKTMYNEYTEGIAKDKDWESKNPNWNKIVLVPVSTTTDTYGNVLKIVHDIRLGSIKLRGGDAYDIPVQIITSKFKG